MEKRGQVSFDYAGLLLGGSYDQYITPLTSGKGMLLKHGYIGSNQGRNE
jgi:hypothetical protein